MGFPITGVRIVLLIFWPFLLSIWTYRAVRKAASLPPLYWTVTFLSVCQAVTLISLWEGAVATGTVVSTAVTATGAGVGAAGAVCVVHPADSTKRARVRRRI